MNSDVEDAWQNLIRNPQRRKHIVTTVKMLRNKRQRESGNRRKDISSPSQKQ